MQPQTNLPRLQQQLSEAIQEKAYMGLDASNLLVKSRTKALRFFDVFNKAREEIAFSTQTAPASQEEINNRITHLRLIQADGEQYYQHYSKKTNTWCRWILKAIARITPEFFKRFLPKLFSNQIAKAEGETRQAYEAFKTYVNGTILQTRAVEQQITQRLATAAAQQQAAENARLAAIQLQTAANAAREAERIAREAAEEQARLAREAELNAQREAERIALENASRTRSLENYSGALTEAVQILNQANEMPISSAKFKILLDNCLYLLKEVIQLEGTTDPKEAICQRTHLDPAVYDVLSQHGVGTDTGLDPEEQLKTALQTTVWGPFLQETEEQKKQVNFAVSKLAGTILTSPGGRPVRASEMANFRGSLRLSAATFTVLTELKNYLALHPQCKPCSIQIELTADTALNGELIDLLTELSETNHEIQLQQPAVSTANILDCNTLNLTVEQEAKLIKLLPKLACKLQELKLTGRPLPDVAPHHYAALCDYNFFNQLGHLVNMNEVPLPRGILDTTDLDLTEFPTAQVPNLLKKLTKLEKLGLSGQPITDAQVSNWVQEGVFDQLKFLSLEDCAQLTTDVLFSLTKLENLKTLYLPELPAGQNDLHDLPSFEDPFKIKLFYIEAPSTRPVATELYTGNHLGAAAFQIPLVRSGVPLIFPAKQETLASSSVAYWLFNRDYEALQPQPGIKSIFADNRAELTDDNIGPFFSKFPNATEISLYNCAISDFGLQALLTALPNIAKVDVRGCENLTDDMKRQNRAKLIFNEHEILALSRDILNANAVSEFLLDDTTGNIDKIRTLDLSGCPDLTNEELKEVLMLLNDDYWLDEGQSKVNTKRLNICTLNLTGCSKITEEAFIEDGRVLPMNSLTQVVYQGTDIPEQFRNDLTTHAQITFQENYTPVLKKINPKEATKLTTMEDRMVCELFPYLLDFAHGQALMNADTLPKDNVISLSLRSNDSTATEEGSYDIPKELLYCKSRYCREGFRPGGIMMNSPTIIMTNQHLTPEVAAVIVDLILENDTVDNIVADLSWEVASSAAEIAGDKNLDLSKEICQKLKNRFVSQFNIDAAFDMLTKAIALEGTNSQIIRQFEQQMILLMTPQNEDVLDGLAQSFGLNTLRNLIVTNRTQRFLAAEQRV